MKRIRPVWLAVKIALPVVLVLVILVAYISQPAPLRIVQGPPEQHLTVADTHHNRWAFCGADTTCTREAYIYETWVIVTVGK